MKYEEIYDDLFNKSLYEDGSWYPFVLPRLGRLCGNFHSYNGLIG